MWIIIYAAILHLVWGVCLIIGPEAAWTTALHDIATATPKMAGVALIAVGLFALWGAREHMRNHWHLHAFIALILQQAVLMASMGSQFMAVVLSQFGDGVVRPRLFIFADQFPGILATVMHTVILFRLFFLDGPINDKRS